MASSKPLQTLAKIVERFFHFSLVFRRNIRHTDARQSNNNKSKSNHNMNTNETKHTPTPWHHGRLDVAGIVSNPHAWRPDIRDAKKHKIATVSAGENSSANAAFIVRACNEYAALVALIPIAEMFIRSHGFNVEKETLIGLTHEHLKENYVMSESDCRNISQAASALSNLAAVRNQ